MKGYQILTALTLLLLSAIGANAQTAKYEYEIKYKDSDGNKKPGTGFLGHYFDYSEADHVYKELVKRSKDLFAPQIQESASEFALSFNTEGNFAFEGSNGMGIVFAMLDETDQDYILIKHNDGNFTNKLGKTSSGDLSYYLSCKRTGENKFLYTLEIELSKKIKIKDVIGKGKRIPIPPSAEDLGDGLERFKCHLEIPFQDKAHESDSRIIVLPYVVKCSTEDTIDYLAPAVYEGKKYHNLQVKRKGYDYAKHDPLGGTFMRITHHSKRDTIHFDPIITYKPKRDKRNRVIIDTLRTTDWDNPVYKYDTLVTPHDSVIQTVWQDTVSSTGFIRHIEDLPHDSAYNMIVIDTTIIWKKPHKDSVYRCIVKYSMEDYHHSYFQEEWPGTCLRIKPYKLLEMGAAAIDIPLTQEFFEAAEEKPQDGNEDIPMKFHHNSATIIEDSITNERVIQLHEMLDNLENSGGKIVEATLEAYASPDGREDINRRLANDRAQSALNRLKLGSKFGKVKTEAIIDTWEHTADTLQQYNHQEEAQAVRDILARTRNSQEAYQEIKKIATYMEVIKPALEKQCRISFKFKFFMKRKLNPKEAVHAYYKNKNDFFSNGDYYNMFAEIKDAKELDILTDIVYNRLITKQKAYDRPLAPYVMNRKAMMAIRSNKPNLDILRPLIDLNQYVNATKSIAGGFIKIKINRPEILLNQAVAHYMMNEQAHQDTAQFIVSKLKTEVLINADQKGSKLDSALTKLENFLNFKILYKTPDRSTEEEIKFQRALAFVELSGPANKAVLYTEFELLNKRGFARQEILKLDDNNPIKWYLMGILWANAPYYGKENDYPLNEAAFTASTRTKSDNPLLTEDEEFDLMEKDNAKYQDYLKVKEAYLSKNPNAKPEPKEKEPKSTITEDGVDMSVNVKGIPYYIAYFQKSFELDHKFGDMYFNDGQVDDNKRKKAMHAYKLSRIPAYKKIFKLRKIDDDRESENIRKSELMKKRLANNDATFNNQN